MNTSDSFKISIPKPCHEDWNKMTPNEQGSFCSKCCKTVIDFTNRSVEEIKNILTEQTGKKVCGRFTNDQLSENPRSKIDFKIPMFQLPKNISYTRAFAIALFIAFGTSLFSCDTQKGDVVGKTEIDTAAICEPQIIDTLKRSTEVFGDTISSIPILGEAEVCKPIKGDVAVEKKKDKSKRKKVSDTIPGDSTIRKIKVFVGEDQ